MSESRLYPGYTHTQIGWVIIVSLIVGAVVVGFLYHDTPLFPPWPIFATLGFILLLFGWLTVTVDDHHLRATFGLWVSMPAIKLADVETAEVVTNSILIGWGIRFLKGGIMYNVSGLQAVQMTTKEGYIYRIGTDDPQGLLRAVRMRLAARP